MIGSSGRLVAGDQSREPQGLSSPVAAETA